MKLLSRAWRAATWVAGGYAIYKQLMTLKEAKDDLFAELAPEQQEQWVRIFGKPEQVTVINPQMPAVRIPQDVSTLEHVQSGT